MIKIFFTCLHLFLVRIASQNHMSEKKYSLLCLHLFLVRIESQNHMNDKKANYISFVYLCLIFLGNNHS